MLSFLGAGDIELVAFLLSPGCGWVWGFLGVFKVLPSKSSELIVSGGAVAHCWQATYTHAGKSISWEGATASAGIQPSWEH